MSEFKILGSNRFPLKFNVQNDELPYYRWEHRVTIGYGLREFILFIDHKDTKVFIEEVTGGSLSRVEDDSLWQALVAFAEGHQLLEISAPILKPASERLI